LNQKTSFEALETDFEALETCFVALKMGFEVGLAGYGFFFFFDLV
jgi:hypothetical protein